MEYQDTNLSFDSKLRALRMQIRRHMNGTASDLMRQMGGGYVVNYGLSLQHIADVAARCSFAPDECDRLWDMKWRETMIIAMHCLGPAANDADRVLRWALSVPTQEVAEQMAYVLTGKMASAPALALQLAQCSCTYALALAAATAARALINGIGGADSAACNLVQHCLAADASLWSVADASALSLLARQMVRRSLGPDVVDHLCRMAREAGSPHALRMAEDVNTEMLYWA